VKFIITFSKLKKPEKKRFLKPGIRTAAIEGTVMSFPLKK